ncbi:NAD(P)/FAD-dependent oxidoreductase (plasmid) [Tistrella mobilis]|uniref:flavin-containing monooxygenase n=1 Tax=Tistrella mobilis TaxID=171437 RepID=UPI003558AB67
MADHANRDGALAGAGDIDQDAAFRAAVAIANIPTLLMVLVQLTGDTRWLEPPYAPERGRGLDDNDDGGLPEDVQAEIRVAATEAILAWRAGRPVAMPHPDDDLLVRMLSVSMAEEVPAEYGEIIASGLGLKAHRLGEPAAAPAGFKVLVIGAGVSGICAAIRLRQRGIACEVIEKGSDFGGTWRENRYPGAGVDTPNHIYSFSFAPHDWTRYFALQGELHGYFRKVARDHGLESCTRFDTRVLRAAWQAEARRWAVTIRRPDGVEEVLAADAVVSAVGVLNTPLVPHIPGLDSFPGPCFHTAEWPEDLDVAGKRVALVGNGASAMQVAPAIAPKVGQLTIFARSKQWAAPFPQFGKEMPQPIRFLIANMPLYRLWYRQRLAWTFNDRVHASLQKDPVWPHPDRALNAVNDGHRRAFVKYMQQELGDRQDLLEKVLPDYPPFGKRMLLDNGWYRTIARDNVELITDHMAEVRGSRLVSRGGEEREADILVLATGFKATEFLGSYEVRGRDDQALSEVWNGDDARAYLGTAVPGFPNFFMLLGPNVGLGHGGSIISAVELQCDYLLSALDEMFRRGAATIEVRPEIHDDYNRRVDEAHAKMVWTHEGMENWYRNSRGRVVAITPWRNDDFWRMTRTVAPADYVFDGRPAAAGDAA